MAEEVKGIDLLKRFVKELVDLGKTVNEQLKDGYQWKDLWAIVVQAKDLTFVFTNFAEIKAEFDDLSVDEIKQLVDELVNDLGLTQDTVVGLVNNTVQFAESGYNLFLSAKALKK